jgi:F0F1-type ATP synthase beta subunit
VVEVAFEPAGPPELFTTLLAADEAGHAVTVQVVQHLPNGRVRAVARDPNAVFAPGMQIAARDEVDNTPLSEPLLSSALEQLLPASSVRHPELLETGVKVVDLLMPLVRGGVVGLLGGERVGTTVVVEELVRRLATSTLSLFTFVPGGVKPDGLRRTREEGYTLGIGRIQTVLPRQPSGAARPVRHRHHALARGGRGADLARHRSGREPFPVARRDDRG